jgi:pyruvate/2-oxoacid:ferredoxin oxidoreductase beta subunit
VHGKVLQGKSERRKELAQICMMHPRTFVAQTSCAMPNHFYKAILAANEYDGPAVISVYTTCQPEHGVGDNMAMAQSKLAVDTRTFPVLMYDPRKGSKISERLSLQGNPATKDDWFKDAKTGELFDFIMFARSESRFSKHFDAEG